MPDLKISGLPAGTAIAGTEPLPGVQSGVTVKFTATQIKTFTSASPTLVTPTIGVASGTSLALGGATIGSDNLGVTGTVTISGRLSAASFVPSSSTVPTNGLYLPAANTVGWAVNSTQIATISEGGAGVGATLKLVSSNGGQIWLGGASAEGFIGKTGSLLTLSGNRRIDIVTTLSGTTSPVININTPNTSGAAVSAGDITITGGNGTGTGASNGGSINLNPGSSTNGTAGSVVVNGNMKTTGVALSALPTAAAAGVGSRRFITDATAPTFGSTAVGGGAVPVPVYSDGANWIVG